MPVTVGERAARAELLTPRLDEDRLAPVAALRHVMRDTRRQRECGGLGALRANEDGTRGAAGSCFALGFAVRCWGTWGNMYTVPVFRKAIADAGNDVTALNCAKCKLDTSITNRTADNKRFDRNTAAYRKHNDRIKFERDKRAQVDKRLKEIEKSKK